MKEQTDEDELGGWCLLDERHDVVTSHWRSGYNYTDQMAVEAVQRIG